MCGIVQYGQLRGQYDHYFVFCGVVDFYYECGFCYVSGWPKGLLYYLFFFEYGDVASVDDSLCLFLWFASRTIGWCSGFLCDVYYGRGSIVLRRGGLGVFSMFFFVDVRFLVTSAYGHVSKFTSVSPRCVFSGRLFTRFLYTFSTNRSVSGYEVGVRCVDVNGWIVGRYFCA